MLTRLKISNTALTAIKLIGLTAMLIDHYNSFVKAEYSPLLYEIGRLALPLFVFVLGYNLARIPTEKMPKMMLQLLVFGVMATPLYNMLDAGLWYWWPLNILFTLMVAVGTVYLLSVPVSGRLVIAVRLAAVLFFIGAGSMVDYFWVGPALVLVVWRLFLTVANGERIILYGSLSVLAVLLCLLNASLAALLALPVILLLIQLYQDAQLPRMKWFFYWFYPGHLLVLLLIKPLAGG
ncbi:MAG TPA: TraX family protein [Thiopseudomonas sp.]|nr:TraX family protein [Thiopseudomonas sp.]